MTPGPDRRTVSFDDNRLLPALFGAHNAHLARIEHQLGVSLTDRANVLTVSGSADSADTAVEVLNALWQRLLRGQQIDRADVDAAVRVAAGHRDPPRRQGALERLGGSDAAVRTRRRAIQPRSLTQAAYIASLRQRAMVFGLGPAGTGKTYLAAAVAVEMLLDGQVERIILSRPAVEAGERLGFLPGDLREKVDPYLRPLYDALHDMLPADQVNRYLDAGTIEIAPLAFMRGRTLGGAFVILDEAQNTTSMQMRMFLTRLGENGRMAVAGDPSQVDLRPGEVSGLHEAVALLSDVDSVDIVRFSAEDVVRHPLVTEIVRAYERHDARQRPGFAAVAAPAMPAGGTLPGDADRPPAAPSNRIGR